MLWVPASFTTFSSADDAARVSVTQPASQEWLAEELRRSIIRSVGDDSQLFVAPEPSAKEAKRGTPRAEDDVDAIVAVVVDDQVLRNAVSDLLASEFTSMLKGGTTKTSLDTKAVTDVVVDAAVELQLLSTEAERQLRQDGLDFGQITTSDSRVWLFSVFRTLAAAGVSAALFLMLFALAATQDRGMTLSHIGRVVLRLNLGSAALYMFLSAFVFGTRQSLTGELTSEMFTAAGWVVLPLFAAGAAVGALVWAVGNKLSDRSPWVEEETSTAVSDWNDDRTAGASNPAGNWILGSYQVDTEDEQ